MKITKELYDKLKLLEVAYLDDKGREMVNPKPMVLPVGFRRPTSLSEQIKRILRTELSAQAEVQGLETFEESNDFDIQDEFDMSEPDTRYQLVEEEYLDEKKIGEKADPQNPTAGEGDNSEDKAIEPKTEENSSAT